ncbi:MAG: HNH endonuclease [Sandaracinaceae bacterium]|nr:HNH endonuclease [Sandaracinaceae bacterium]
MTLQGFVAVTDPGWYERLAQTPGPRDANFWRPSTRAFRLDVGTPFFFKLKAPHNAIAGFGYFAGFSVLPDWLAWDTFGTANGVDDLDALRRRLRGIQAKARIEADVGGRIGCCLIAEAIFFGRADWVAAPKDWAVRTQTGARYDLSLGEGLRIWEECRARSSPSIVAESVPSPRYGSPQLHRPRLGQSIFRVRVIDAYDRSCAVTQEHSLPVVEAAHIKPYAQGGEHTVSNGLALRTDLHRLFDRGYIGVDEDHRLVVGDRLRREFDNGRSYYQLAGRRLLLPRDPSLRPTKEALDWHRERVFLG